MAKKKLLHVKCSKCGKDVGLDPAISVIEACSTCSGKPKAKPIKTAAEAFARTKKGNATDLPSPYNTITFRSGWERNFARYLCAIGKEWKYEERVFTFKVAKNGEPYRKKPFLYIPDFQEVGTDIFWEIKGYLRSEDRSKMKRFKFHYPEEFKRLKAVISKSNKKAKAFYESMGVPITLLEDIKDKWKSKIPAWE